MKQTLIRGLLNLLPMALSLWLFWSLFESLDSLGKLLFSLVGMDTVFTGAGFILVTAWYLLPVYCFPSAPSFGSGAGLNGS